MRELERARGFDAALLLNAVLLWVIGIALIHSATHIHQTGPLAGVARSQMIWSAMGVVLILIMVSIPTVFYFSFAYIFYGVSLCLLAAILFSPVVSKGASRWMALGPIRIQPSEFAKIGLLLALARHLSTKTVSLNRPGSLLVPGLLILVPFVLVLRQPDLGTAMVFSVMAVPLLFWAGLSLSEMFLLISPGISLVLSLVPLIIAFGTGESTGVAGSVPWGLFFIFVCAFLYFMRPRVPILILVVAANLFTAGITTVLWNSFLADYQKGRIISFINPQADPAGAGYQVIQSKVAIGSGALFGKGYLQGTQTRLSFLPEQHTDFIFSVLGEQFGLLGCTVVLMMFLFLVVRGFLGTRSEKNRFTNLLVVGASSILAFHVFVNVAMTLGMMPVTGLPLPFLSYGGSFTVTVAILVGFLLNARVSPQNF